MLGQIEMQAAIRNLNTVPITTDHVENAVIDIKRARSHFTAGELVAKSQLREIHLQLQCLGSATTCPHLKAQYMAMQELADVACENLGLEF